MRPYSLRHRNCTGLSAQLRNIITVEQAANPAVQRRTTTAQPKSKQDNFVRKGGERDTNKVCEPGPNTATKKIFALLLLRQNTS